MVTEFPKIAYDYEKIRLTKLFEHDDVAAFPEPGVETDDSRAVFGPLKFPTLPADRTYNFASFVTSIDGKIAFLDNPAGPVIAQSNALDPDGADADFWILNLMRASADVVVGGAVTLQKEPDGLVCLFDQGLEDARVQAGKPKAPWFMVCSLDGTDIPFGDTLLANQPVIFNTSPAGLKHIERNIRNDYYVVGPYVNADAIDAAAVAEDFRKQAATKAPVIVTGEGSRPDSLAVVRILRLMGMERALIESPSMCHSFMMDGLLDEMTLNYSCIYVGGGAVGLGNGMKPFTSTNHPHTEMLSIHSHSPSFFYFRHRILYGRQPEGYLGSVY